MCMVNNVKGNLLNTHKCKFEQHVTKETTMKDILQTNQVLK